jgi:hypothetical protein
MRMPQPDTRATGASHAGMIHITDRRVDIVGRASSLEGSSLANMREFRMSALAALPFRKLVRPSKASVLMESRPKFEAIGLIGKVCQA